MAEENLFLRINRAKDMNNLTDLEYEENGIILNEFLEEWITSNYFE